MPLAWPNNEGEGGLRKGRRCMAKWRTRLLQTHKILYHNDLESWSEFATCSAQRGELAPEPEER
ncbi:MAG TPA: hypothetical protein VKD72_08315 [Gemmataceae bacterium]|nr:hypothetical protein [Gemmataceae bacterium]